MIKNIRFITIVLLFSLIIQKTAFAKGIISFDKLSYYLKHPLILTGIIIFLLILINYIKTIIDKKNQELNQVNAKLIEKEKYYYSIFNESPFAIILIDQNFNIIEWNKASEMVFGWSRAEVIGKKDINLILPPPLKDKYLNEIGNVGNCPANVVNNNLTKAGKIITCEWNNSYITDDKGNVKQIMAVAQNITERINQENLFKEQQNTLHSNSKELEAHITKLESTNKKVEDLSHKLEKIIELTDGLYESSMKDEEDFLSNLLRTAAILIPEVDYGSVYIYKDNKVKYIDALGHNIEILRELSIDSEIFLNKPSDDILILKDIADTTSLKLDKETKQRFINATKPIKETLIFDLYLHNERIAGISLDLGTSSDKTFDENAKKIMLSFRNLTNAFFTIQRYSKIHGEFQKEIVISIIQLLEIHDNYTKNHSQNVATLSESIARKLNLSDVEVENAYWAGLVHDIGKIIIPSEILNKNDKLLDDEYEQIKKHPYWGYLTLSQTKYLKDIANYVLYHHERWDGSGYPSGIKEDEIPIVSQIITVADSWDAMQSDRSYRTKIPKELALKEIVAKSGIQFSPKVVKAFLAVIEKEYSAEKSEMVG